MSDEPVKHGAKMDLIHSISQIPGSVHPDDLDGFVQDIAEAVREHWALERAVKDHLIAAGHSRDLAIAPRVTPLTHVGYLNRTEAAKFTEAGLSAPTYRHLREKQKITDYRKCVMLKYDMLNCPDAHPQDVMSKLGESLGFVVVGAVPQTIGECWWFWVVIDELSLPDLPEYLSTMKWFKIGTA